MWADLSKLPPSTGWTKEAHFSLLQNGIAPNLVNYGKWHKHTEETVIAIITV